MDIDSIKAFMNKYKNQDNISYCSYSYNDVGYSQEEIREELITNMLNINSKNILYNTTIKGDLREFKKLIKKGYPLLEEISPANYYWTPLHYAMNYGKMEIALYILRKLKEKNNTLYKKAMALETNDKKTPVLCLLRSNVLSSYSIGECFIQ